MNKLKKLAVAGLSSLFALGAVMVAPTSASAATTANNLGDLVVLEALFDGNDSSGILSSQNGGVDLGNLVVLDQLFGSGNLTSGRLFGTSATNKSSLGNLIILNEIFNDNDSLNLGGGDNNLGRLFVLDRLFAR